MITNYNNMFSTCKYLSRLDTKTLPLTSYYENRNSYNSYKERYNLYHGKLNLSDTYRELNNTIALTGTQKNKVKETIIEKYNNYNNKVDTDKFSSNELELLNILSEDDKIVYKTAKQLESKYNLEIEKENIKNRNTLSTLNILTSVFIALTLISLVSLHTLSIAIFTTLSIPLFVLNKKLRLKYKQKELIKLIEFYN